MIKLVGGQLNQWDVGRSVLVTGDATHVHFANRGDSKALIQEIVDGEAKIPDHLLRTGKVLVAYTVLKGVTLESMYFPVKKREKPEHYEYTDEMNYLYVLISEAENATNAANKAASDILDAKERGEFNVNSDDELTEMWLEMSELREQRASVQSWPVLKTGRNWLVGSGFDTTATRPNITELHFVKEYTPTGSETVYNPASSGSITGYIRGTIVTICTNGAEKVRLNADSMNIFGALSNLKKFTGIELIDASLVENFTAAFYNFGLEELDISGWHLERVTNCTGTFNNCANLKRVKFSKYGISAVTTTESMFSECPELVDVDLGRGLTVVSINMFKKCPKLETIEGLRSVTSIGEDAFLYTPSLVSVDINPELIQSIGKDACRLSSIEDSVDLSVVDLSVVGDMATRHKRWNTVALKEIHNVSLPTVYLEVPGADNQGNYPDIDFTYSIKPGESSAEMHTVATAGCSAVTIYHEYQALHAKTTQYRSFGEWWAWFNDQYSTKNNGRIFCDDNNMGNNYPYGTADSEAIGCFPIDAMLHTIGWSHSNGWKNYSETVVSAEPLRKIAKRLSENKATFVTIHSVNIPGNHAVLIVGADAITEKLAVLDGGAPGTEALLLWLRFEDIFDSSLYNSDRVNDSIDPHEYN